MKRLLIVPIVFVTLAGCSNGSSGSDMKDNSGATTTPATDTLKPPSGVDNSSVISTDTAAMNVQNSVNKAKDSMQKK